MNELAAAPETKTQRPSAGAVAESYIDKREVGRRLQAGMRTIDTWMRLGFLPYYKVGNSVRFKWSEVEQHLGQHCRVCPSSPSKP